MRHQLEYLPILNAIAIQYKSTSLTRPCRGIKTLHTGKIASHKACLQLFIPLHVCYLLLIVREPLEQLLGRIHAHIKGVREVLGNVPGCDGQLLLCLPLIHRGVCKERVLRKMEGDSTSLSHSRCQCGAPPDRSANMATAWYKVEHLHIPIFSSAWLPCSEVTKATLGFLPAVST